MNYGKKGSKKRQAELTSKGMLQIDRYLIDCYIFTV